MAEDRMEGSRQTTELVSQLVSNVSALTQAMNNNGTPQARRPHVNVEEEVRNVFRPSNSSLLLLLVFKCQGRPLHAVAKARNVTCVQQMKIDLSSPSEIILATRETILVTVSSHEEGKGTLQQKQGNHLDHLEETLFCYLAQKMTSYPDKG
eukprot:gene2278-2622_t